MTQKPLADAAPIAEAAPELTMLVTTEGAVCSDGVCELPRP